MTSDTVALVDGLGPGWKGLAFDLCSGAGDAAFEAASLCRSLHWVCIDKRIDLLAAAAEKAPASPDGRSSFLFACCDAASVPLAFSAGCAGLVLCNPPWGPPGCTRAPLEGARRDARIAPDSFGAARFVAAAGHLLEAGGVLRILTKPQGLGALLRSLDAFGLGSPVVRPWGSPGEPALLARVDSVKGGRRGLVLLPQEPLPAFARPAAP